MKIPWGAFDLETGKWYPNEYLPMSEEKQRESNIKDGYLCECGYMPTRCKCGRPKMTTIKQTIDAQTENDAMRRLLYWKFGSDPDCWNAIQGQFKDYTSGSQDFSSDVCGLIDYAGELESEVARLKGIIKKFVYDVNHGESGG